MFVDGVLLFEVDCILCQGGFFVWIMDVLNYGIIWLGIYLNCFDVVLICLGLNSLSVVLILLVVDNDGYFNLLIFLYLFVIF